MSMLATGGAGGNGTTSSSVLVQVEGAPLNPQVAALLVAAEVDTSLFTPSQFRLLFRGDSSEVLMTGGLQLAVTVTLQASDGSGPVPLLTGEVTAVEIEFGPEGKLVVVRGMDRSHRLMHGTSTTGYMEMTSSDVVTLLVGAAGLVPGQIEPTSYVYPSLTCSNLSAWDFIQLLAAREGYVAYTDSLGLFNFCAMPLPETGPPPAMSAAVQPQGAQLLMGDNLIHLRGTVRGAEQVVAVTATGYNPSVSAPVVSPIVPTPSTAQSLDPATLPVAVGGELGGATFFDASWPIESEAQGLAWASAIASKLAGALAELEGQCIGNPAIVAGKAFSLGLAGAPFDGQYVCSSARHVFEPGNGGYSTWFTVGGWHDRSILALASPTPPATSKGRIPGLALGIVVDNNDPESHGRVKVSLPWLSADVVTGWAPTVQMGAGVLGYGSLFLPEVGDSVLVGFDRGDIDHPYVIGNLYSGLGAPEPAPEVNAGVASRRIMSKMRHCLEFDDGPDKVGITLSTGDKTMTLSLDAEKQTLTVTSLGKLQIQAGPEGLAIASQGDLSIEATGSLSLKSDTGQTTVDAAGGFSVTSQGSVGFTGNSFSATSTGSATITASSVTISAPTVNLGA